MTRIIEIPPYTLLRSKRKTIGIFVTDRVTLIIKAPVNVSDQIIIQSIKKHLSWINKRMLALKTNPHLDVWDLNEIKKMRLKANEMIIERVEKYARIMGVKYTSINIRSNTTRWGSCSSTGRLSFNCILVKTPIEVTDYVVVHELAHLLQMNHSKKFYSIIENFYPQYKISHQWLKKEGYLLLLKLKRSLEKLKSGIIE